MGILGIPSNELKRTLANTDRTLAGVDQVLRDASLTLAAIRRTAEHVEAIVAVIRAGVERRDG